MVRGGFRRWLVFGFLVFVAACIESAYAQAPAGRASAPPAGRGVAAQQPRIYANMVQLRLNTSRPGAFSTTYATADIMISGSTWTQVYPEPAAVTATTTTVAATPTGPVTSGTSVTFTATVTPANTAVA